MKQHQLAREDVDLGVLAEDLSERLGRPVALSARAPQAVIEPVLKDIEGDVDVIEDVEVPVLDDAGEPTGETRLAQHVTTVRGVVGNRQVGEREVALGGVLILLDPDTGEELDVDPKKVTAALEAHVPKPRVDRRAQLAAMARTGLTNAERDEALALLLGH